MVKFHDIGLDLIFGGRVTDFSDVTDFSMSQIFVTELYQLLYWANILLLHSITFLNLKLAIKFWVKIGIRFHLKRNFDEGLLGQIQEDKNVLSSRLCYVVFVFVLQKGKNLQNVICL